MAVGVDEARDDGGVGAGGIEHGERGGGHEQQVAHEGARRHPPGAEFAEAGAVDRVLETQGAGDDTGICRHEHKAEDAGEQRRPARKQNQGRGQGELGPGEDDRGGGAAQSSRQAQRGEGVAGGLGFAQLGKTAENQHGGKQEGRHDER